MSDKEKNIQYCDIDPDIDSFELYDELQKIFSDHHKKFCEFFKGVDVVLASTDEEMIPFMYVISHISLSNLNYNYSEKDVLLLLEIFFNWANKLSFKNDILKTFDERLHLYTTIVRNEKKPRYEWLMFNAPEDNSNLFARCHGVLGDILINPACADDYENAPIVLHDIFDLVDFQKKMVGFYPLIKDFIDEVMDCYNLYHIHKMGMQQIAKKKREPKSDPIGITIVILFSVAIIVSIILIALLY